MKIGIISDIHSNLEALEVVLSNLRVADKIICLGDITGYGPNPNECVDKIRYFGIKTIIGNHDLAVIGKYDIEYFNPYAKRAILWTSEKLTGENKKFLDRLNEIEIFENSTYVHASLVDFVSTYITDSSSARECFELLKTNICFIGHTHIAEYYFKEEKNIICQNIKMWSGGKIEIKECFSYIINCGSVGQPRDRNPKASFGIYDTKKNIVEIIRCDYPYEITKRKMMDEKLPRILYERLEIGW